MSVEIATPNVWECTRLVIADSLTTHAERSECLTLIVDGLVEITRKRGGDRADLPVVDGADAGACGNWAMR